MTAGYYAITRITDYGPYITKIILPMPEMVGAEAVCAEKFSAYVERMDEKGHILSLPKSWMALDDREPSKGYVPVLDAYPSDADGNRKEEGDYVTLDMQYGPLTPLSSTISAPEQMNICINSRYEITQLAEIEGKKEKISGLKFDYCLKNFSPDAAGFIHATSHYEAEPLNYGYFVPQTGSKKKPLIIWLHGAGEGGVDPTVAYTGNKVVRLASKEVQELFGGAYVLVPQTKTFWMNDGTGTYGNTGRSIYVKALKAAIDEFVANNPAIDRNRIYIGGDSNGGFMTMKMIIAYPNFFAAAFPVCEALIDKRITDKQIERMAEMPIWFTHAKNDPIVNPNETVVPTYKRLMAAGAKNVHFTYWDKIEDIHEGFCDAEGKPFEYIGHFAWVPMLNDDCKVDFDGSPVKIGEREVTLLEWLACQVR